MKITDVQVKVELGETYRILMSGVGRYAVQRMTGNGNWAIVAGEGVPAAVQKVVAELNGLFVKFE